MRQIIISAIGLAIIAAGFLGMNRMGAIEKPEREKAVKNNPSVFTQKVINVNNSISVTASGNLAARDRIELFSEVQGIFEYSSASFKPGAYYKSGAVLWQQTASV